MFDHKVQNTILSIWDQYNNSEKIVNDTKGLPVTDINERRKECLPELLSLIDNFMNKNDDVTLFKYNIDSFNKHHNYWGFTSIKGQMFFNQLVKVSSENEKQLTEILRKTISVPSSIKEANQKIDMLCSYCHSFYDNAEDKRKVPNPGSVCYYLSYFWQIFDYKKWPIMYTSLVESFSSIEIWKEQNTESETYDLFFSLNNEMIKLIIDQRKITVINWDIEHAFWNFNGNPILRNKQQSEDKLIEEESTDPSGMQMMQPSFEMEDYIIPKISNLYELGNIANDSHAKKGSEFEQLAAEAFRQFDFEVEMLGQGTGRNPDFLLRSKQTHTAFIVDAKAYSEGYSLGTDDRAIKEYIDHHCAVLKKEGFEKIGFIIVSNSFKGEFDEFINQITWKTDIKRFILLETKALLYLIAYKNKEHLDFLDIIDCLTSIANPVNEKEIIARFEDV